MNNLSIREAQQIIDKYINSFEEGYFSELTQMAQLTEEVGEVARIISRTYGDQVSKKSDKLNLPDELADVLFVLICLANQTNIDLTDALRKNLDKKIRRDKNRYKKIKHS